MGIWLENTEVIPIGSKKWHPLGVAGPPKDENYAQIFSLNNAEILIWPPDYKVTINLHNNFNSGQPYFESKLNSMLKQNFSSRF